MGSQTVRHDLVTEPLHQPHIGKRASVSLGRSAVASFLKLEMAVEDAVIEMDAGFQWDDEISEMQSCVVALQHQA